MVGGVQGVDVGVATVGLEGRGGNGGRERNRGASAGTFTHP